MATTHIPGPPTDHLPRRSRPMGSLVAAARRLSGRKVTRSKPETWQDEGWDLYDEVGELRFVANTLAGAASRARIFGAVLPTGDEDPSPIDPDAPETPDGARVAAQAVQHIGGGALGRAELIRRLVIQLFVPGDGFLIGLRPGVLDTAGPTDDDPTPGIPVEGRDEGTIPLEDLSWHALSVNEVSMRAGKVVLNIGDATPREIDQNEAIVVRVWRPHPRKWWAADSPVRANLPVLRELVGLTKHVGANIDSRLAGAGLLVLGQSVEVMGAPGQPNTPAEGDENSDPFVQALVETMATALEDRDSAASIVPLTIKVPDEAVDKVRHISFSTPFDSAAKELRDEAIRRLALGLDAPPEVLLGLGSTNHWSAWQIEEATVKTHIEPLLSLVCDALTTDYLWPVLEEARVENARDYVVWMDTTELTLRPNRTSEAQSLYDAGELSGQALRREAGFDDADAPEQPDRAVEIALRIIQDAPALLVEPGLDEIIGRIRTAIDQGKQVARDEDTTTPDVTAPDGGGDDAGSGMDLPDTQDDPPPEMAASALTVPTNGAARA